jgi:hypothetical protein
MGRSGKAGQWVKAFPRKWETADALGQRRVCIAAMAASLYARSMSLGGGGPSASQAPRRNHRQRIIPAPFALRSGHDHPQGLASRLTTSSRPGLTAGNSAEPLLLPTLRRERHRHLKGGAVHDGHRHYDHDEAHHRRGTGCSRTSRHDDLCQDRRVRDVQAMPFLCGARLQPSAAHTSVTRPVTLSAIGVPLGSSSS